MEAVRRTKSVGGTRRGSVPKKKANARKASKLSKEVVEAAEKGSEYITLSVMRRAVSGKSHGAELVFSLEERPEEAEGETNRPLPASVARQLAAEPQWSGPIDEHEAETMSGRREPEGG